MLYSPLKGKSQPLYAGLTALANINPQIFLMIIQKTVEQFLRDTVYVILTVTG